MNKYVCLAHRFPAAGIEGVLGVPVQNEDEINDYKRHMLGVVPNQRIRFVRLTSIPDQAKNHLKVGDVVIKYDGLSEKFLDVLRPVETAYLLSKYKAGDIDWEHAEDVRRYSLESFRWQISSDGYQIVICDPHGRLAILRGQHGTPRRLFPTAYCLLQETENDKKLVSDDPYVGRRVSISNKQRCAWATMRFIHHCLFKHGPVVDSSIMYEFKKKIRRHNRVFTDLPKVEFSNFVRLHTRRTHKHSQDFWGRVRKEYLDDPASLPRPLSFIASKRSVRWVRLTMEEVEEVLNYVEWDEWTKFRDPLHFSNVRKKSSGSAEWN
tara:strand:+ start:129 stop:1094 length:966 start_codon:yes stop_codon:yes gene_type:complete